MLFRHRRPCIRFRSSRLAARSGGLASAAAFLLASSAGASPATPGNLFVTSDASNVVREYTGTTGALQGIFCGSVANGQMAIHYNASGTRVLIGHAFGGVEERDASTGALLQTYEPAGGWQWAGIYAPTGNVYIGSMTYDDVREYDISTGNFIRVVAAITDPADMRIGPNGNLYICSFTAGFVMEVNAVSGAFVSLWSLPPGSQANDITFLPNGEILVTAMRTNMVYRYDSVHNLVGSFTHANWGNPHGIVLSPHTGNILVADGASAQIYEFNATTFALIDPAFLNPEPGDKIVDLEFRPGTPPIAVTPLEWGAMKRLYR